MIKVLHIISELGDGGVEAMLMNLYRNIDREKIQFDFLVHSKINNRYTDEIEKMGGRIFYLDNMINIGIKSYVIKLVKLLKENKDIDVVHAHILLQNGFILLAAKLAGIKIRISHSHLTTYHRKVTKILAPLLKSMILIFATDRVACGLEAGRHLYGNFKFNVIPNAINMDKFIEAKPYDKIQLQKQYSIKDTDIVIGHIGRITEQKNTDFIIDIARFFKGNISEDFKIILVGTGPNEDKIRKKIDKYKLNKHVILLGSRNDIDRLLKTFDVLILPSLYEGLPVVLVEAQASGIKSLVSDSITKEVDLGLNSIEYLSLNDKLEIWCEKIENLCKSKRIDNEKIKKMLTKRGYEIKSSSINVSEFYEVARWKIQK